MIRFVKYFTSAVNGVVLLVCLVACSQMHLPDRMLWYNKPADHFEEALPLGNGRMGATVFGGVKTERILLNEATLWAGGPVDAHMNPDAYKHIPAVRKALFDGDYQKADRLVRQIQGKFSESYAPLGDLLIEMNHDSIFTDYRRDLDLRNAVATTQYTVDGRTYFREFFVSHPHRVMVIRMKTGIYHPAFQSTPL